MLASFSGRASSIPRRTHHSSPETYSIKLRPHSSDTASPGSARVSCLKRGSHTCAQDNCRVCPDVREALNKLHPLEATRRVQEISDDLDWGRMPEDHVDYATWRDERNRQEASRPHKP